MAAHLANGRVNVALLREAARRELIELLDKCNGTKWKQLKSRNTLRQRKIKTRKAKQAIVWDESLAGPFSLIAEFGLLRDHQVTQMFHLSNQRPVSTTAQHVIYMVRPRLTLMDIIAEQVLEQARQPSSQRKEFHVFFVPRKSQPCVRQLEERGVYGELGIEEYALELFPVDSDVLSMEMAASFKECHVEEDTTSMHYVARALITLQSLYGVIPNVYAKGKMAKLVGDLLVRLRREQVGREAPLVPQVDTLLLLDRQVDLLTPLATQLTYQGLLDELFGVQHNLVRLPEASSSEGAGSRQQLCLNSAEELFAELRDRNFNAVGPLLSREAKSLTSQYEVRHDAKTIGEIKQFVDRLPSMQLKRKSLANHTSLAEEVKKVTDQESFFENLAVEQEFMNGVDTDKVHPHIEDCIARQEDIVKVLRLVCMQSVANNGLRPKVLDHYRREILQTYGYRQLLWLLRLEKAGLLQAQEHKNHFSTLRKTLKLNVEDVSEQVPNDLSYVYSGYAPLSVRLAQFLALPGWRAISEALTLLPGPTLTDLQQRPPAGRMPRRGSVSSLHSSSAEEPKVTLVFFLGGCTYAEISALRFLSQQDDAPVEYLVATTKLINGRTFLQSLNEPLNSPL
ncbi:vacuolar protein sorting-associated protein 33A isoform X1 [Dermacentor andersoni]|uniref:vacuolar protein sorting-associated protein 33A isoform X1 n=2 Tax=Dermacentor andersoni TaxID=34620 RepID=UPI003B3A8CC2